MPGMIDERIRRWRLELALHHGLLKRELDELEDHLREQVACAEDQEAGVEAAIERLGEPGVLARELRRVAGRSVLVSWVGFAVLAGTLWCSLILDGSPLIYIDVPSTLLIVGGLAGGLVMMHRTDLLWRALGVGLGRQLPRDADEVVELLGVFRSGRQLAWAVGWLGTLINVIMMVNDLRDVVVFGAVLSVAMLTALYGVVLAELVFAPMQRRMEDRLGQVALAARQI